MNLPLVPARLEIGFVPADRRDSPGSLTNSARGVWSGTTTTSASREEIDADNPFCKRTSVSMSSCTAKHAAQRHGPVLRRTAPKGYAFTHNGWVQAYGSRCTRPPILLYGDIARPKPMTVEWIAYAQSLTDKPVKGMLTGPVTMIARSFVRQDQPLYETAEQLALVIRDEIADLEAAGIAIIQVDEPAIRELLPLREDGREAYLEWAVDAFRLATGGAKPETQIHTHLTYSARSSVVDAIERLDADVTAIVATRSITWVLEALKEGALTHGVGPGVYESRSARIPEHETSSTAHRGKRIDLSRSFVGQPGRWPQDPPSMAARAFAAQHGCGREAPASSRRTSGARRRVSHVKNTSWRGLRFAGPSMHG